ncbi:ATP-binding protein [Chrysiogenes arsenatis]|uniref:ATP-binding protein n=1 Tax=Chrysiogenes arsenatis TaxID=309797 RepID=UPI000404B5E2|nr:ATP-binding protein [Chrysiogenes arsenatis]
MQLIDGMLKELRLSGFKQHLSSLQDQALENSWSYSEFLSHLCEREIANRFQTRVSNWRRESSLNNAKNLTNLSLENYPREVMQTIRQLQQSTDWVDGANNILFFGPSGVGKSHIANALGLHLIDQGVRVKALSAVSLVQQLQTAKTHWILLDL